MRIKVRLDVSLPLKRKKKIMVENDHVFYARFQYEKLTLFYFVCGKLGHGESFCKVRVRVDPSKIVFGWDVSLHAVAKKRYASVSRWLCESNDSIFQNLDKESGDNGCNVRDEGDMWLDLQDNMENLYAFPNLFYDNLEERYKRSSWDLLRQLEQDQSIPWLVVGDFNKIAFSFEKIGRCLRSKRYNGKVSDKDEEGMGIEIEVTEGAEMLCIASEYLLELFTTSNVADDMRILGLVQRKITNSKDEETGKRGNFALKLDMSKAYDKVGWDFVAGMMTKLGFHANWITLAMRFLNIVERGKVEWGHEGGADWCSLEQLDLIMQTKGCWWVRTHLLPRGAFGVLESCLKKARVGILGGGYVNIWNDSWLPEPRDGRVSCQNIKIQWAIVNLLMNDDTATWNADIVLMLCGSDQVERVLKILSKLPDVVVKRYEETVVMEAYEDYDESSDGVFRLQNMFVLHEVFSDEGAGGDNANDNRNTKEVKFKEMGEDLHGYVIVDSDTVPGSSWKDMLLKGGSFGLMTSLDDF
ncbi:reverse transcriptase [Gossypium australe]|uniref:Reverse transcriptase n=1 Tax=Gossypium australe TaxID=47621 RepID=A0A5B6V9Q4_9ROSI|nr:reverse transcriptase [Gossypium australe]